jgi:hypothetical protein
VPPPTPPKKPSPAKAKAVDAAAAAEHADDDEFPDGDPAAFDIGTLRVELELDGLDGLADGDGRRAKLRAVERALAGCPGVLRARVDGDACAATVALAPRALDRAAAALVGAVEGALDGVTAARRATLEFALDGGGGGGVSAAAAPALRAALARVDGVVRAAVGAGGATARVVLTASARVEQAAAACAARLSESFCVRFSNKRLTI